MVLCEGKAMEGRQRSSRGGEDVTDPAESDDCASKYY